MTAITATRELPRSRSVSLLMGSVLLALAPALIHSVWLEGQAFAIRLVLLIAVALAVESLLLRLRGQPVARQLWDLSAPLSAVLLALVLPTSLPWWMPCLAIITAIGVAKQAFGGLGDNPFNPAMAGYALLLVMFPASFQALFAPTPSLVTSVLLAAGGATLLARRIIAWQAPLGFVAGAGCTFLACAAIAGSDAPIGHPSVPQLLLASFFIVTDPVTGCQSGRGRALFGIGAGALLVLLGGKGQVADSLPFAILLMNCAASWIDEKTRPVPVTARLAG